MDTSTGGRRIGLRPSSFPSSATAISRSRALVTGASESGVRRIRHSMRASDATTASDEPLRFAFGANWRRYLSTLTPDRIRHAEASLLDMLGDQTLQDRRFLDIGCGSGLFSLAARRLGA